MSEASQSFLTEAPAGMLGESQLRLLATLSQPYSSFYDVVSSNDSRTTVAAIYLHEQQEALGYSLSSPEFSGGARLEHRRWIIQEKTREARLGALLRDRLAQNTPHQPANPNDFNSLMTHSATTEIREQLQRDHERLLENEVVDMVARIGASLTESQLAWEMTHGTTNKHGIDIAAETRAMLRAASRAFRRSNTPVSPQELSRRMDLPETAAGLMISHLVSIGAITRNIGADTLTPTELIIHKPFWSTFGRQVVDFWRVLRSGEL